MKRFLASALVVGLGLAVVLMTTNEAAAKGRSTGGRNSHGTHSRMHNHSHHTHHHRTLHRGHHNWSSWRWNSRFGCYYYWYPSERCYYYWYAPSSCYYPVSSIDDYPPPATQYQTASPGVAPLPIIQVTNINQNGQNGVLPTVPGPVPGPVAPPGR